MKVFLSDVNQKIIDFEKASSGSSTVKLLGKQGHHLGIQLKTKLSTLQEKITPFFKYIGLSIVTLGGRAGFESMCNSFSKAEENWKNGVRVETLEIYMNDTQANGLVTVWDKVHNGKEVDCSKFKMAPLFDSYSDVSYKQNDRLTNAVSNLVNVAPRSSKAIWNALKSIPAAKRATVAEKALSLVEAVGDGRKAIPLVKAVRDGKPNSCWYSSEIIRELGKAPLEEMDLIVKQLRPFVKKEPHNAATFINLFTPIKKGDGLFLYNKVEKAMPICVEKGNEWVRAFEIFCKDRPKSRFSKLLK